jgi:3-hydroxyisobutyrate dehydrogenase
LEFKELNRVGFVGLGRMGAPMARHLAAAAKSLLLYDAAPGRARELAEEIGGSPVETLDELSGCDSVVLMLPSSAEVSEVVAGPGGLLDGLSPGALIVDCSSSDPMETRKLAEAAAARGIGLVDAPVAGGVVFAQDATLDALAGGAPADIARATPVLAAFARKVVHCGVSGAGHAIKCVNNFVNSQLTITYAEALSVLLRFGIGAGTAVDVLADATTGRNHPFTKKIGAQVLTGRFASGMAMALIEKDIRTARDLARGMGLAAPVATLCAERFAAAVETLGPGADQTEVVRLWERNANLEIRLNDE